MEDKSNNTIKTILILIIIAAIIGLTVFFVKGRNKNTDSNNNNNTQTTPTPTASLTPTSTLEPTNNTEQTPTTTISTAPTSSINPSATPTPTGSITPTPTLAQNKVRVYYSVDPESYDDFTYAFFFELTTNSTNRGEFALNKLISGPTAEQKENQKVFTPVKLTGDSNCSGKDFTLTIDQENKKGTVQFCKNVTTSGVGDDARIKVTVTNTLKDTLSLENVVILTKDGNCFGDQSGLNQCKK